MSWFLKTKECLHCVQCLLSVLFDAASFVVKVDSNEYYKSPQPTLGSDYVAERHDR